MWTSAKSLKASLNTQQKTSKDFRNVLRHQRVGAQSITMEVKRTVFPNVEITIVRKEKRLVKRLPQLKGTGRRV